MKVEELKYGMRLSYKGQVATFIKTSSHNHAYCSNNVYHFIVAMINEIQQLKTRVNELERTESE